MADNAIEVTATIDAQNEGTDWLQLRAQRNFFNIHATGFNGHTLHLQAKRRDEAAGSARDIESYTAATHKIGEMAGHWDVRLFCKTGNFGTGDLTVELVNGS